jgi:hypothetical protein
MRATRKLWIGMAALILLSPLGLILPARLGAGSAWGEWSAEEIKSLVGYVPFNLGKLSETWKAPIPDYAAPGQEKAGLKALSGSYIISAVIGVAVVVAASLLLGKLMSKKDGNEPSSLDDN